MAVDNPVGDGTGREETRRGEKVETGRDDVDVIDVVGRDVIADGDDDVIEDDVGVGGDDDIVEEESEDVVFKLEVGDGL